MPMLHAENGYDLWLRYQKVDNSQLLNSYSKTLAKLNFPVNSATLTEAKNELQQGLNGLLDTNLPETDGISKGTLLVGTPASSKVLSGIHAITNEISGLGDEGFLIKTLKVNGTPCTVIAARKDMGVMYGVFHFLRLLQTQSDIKELNITQVPKLQRRMLNHWDNLNGTIERGYAGYTLWDWQRLPGIHRSALSRLCPRQRFYRYQWHRSEQCKCQRTQPDHRISDKGSRPCRCFPSLRHPGISDSPFQCPKGTASFEYSRSAGPGSTPSGGKIK